MRLVHVGNAVVDVVLPVPGLPGRGEDVLAGSSRWVAGGGVNVMLAAARQRADVAYGGAHGIGPMGRLVRATLREEGIGVLLPATRELDTGFVVALVLPDGERSFVTVAGAETTLDSHQLTRLRIQPDDVVYVSGYGLLQSPQAQERARWVAGLRRSVRVFFDPGPLVMQIPAAALEAVLGRADWCSVNSREAALLTGIDEPDPAARALALRTGRLAVIVRTGPQGCLLVDPEHQLRTAPVPAVQVVDTSGAGDVHAGVFLAAIISGEKATSAALMANVAAAFSVTRPGPDAAPTDTQLGAFIKSLPPR